MKESIKNTLLTILNKKVDWAGGQLQGMLKTKYLGQALNGSYCSECHTVQSFIDEVRYSNGGMGSLNITTAYSKDGVTIPATWYNFLYIPHRSGGDGSGGAVTDNCNYGTLILFGMTGNQGMFVIRYSSATIAWLKKIY